MTSTERINKILDLFEELAELKVQDAIAKHHSYEHGDSMDSMCGMTNITRIEEVKQEIAELLGKN